MYADLLRKMKAEPYLSEFGKHVRKIRRTRENYFLNWKVKPLRSSLTSKM